MWNEQNHKGKMYELFFETKMVEKKMHISKGFLDNASQSMIVSSANRRQEQFRSGRRMIKWIK